LKLCQLGPLFANFIGTPDGDVAGSRLTSHDEVLVLERGQDRLPRKGVSQAPNAKAALAQVREPRASCSMLSMRGLNAGREGLSGPGRSSSPPLALAVPSPLRAS
jgi:hypothetical protein